MGKHEDMLSQLDHLAVLNNAYACPCDESPMYSTFLVPERAKGMQVWMKGDEKPYLDLVRSVGLRPGV